MASRTASLTKFSEAISSSPSCWRRTSLSMAVAICGSTSASGCDIHLEFIASVPISSFRLSYERRLMIAPDLLNFVDPALVPPSLEARGQKLGNDRLGGSEVENPCAQAEHVSVVVSPAHFRFNIAGDVSRANTRHLVRRHRHADPRAAYQDAEIGPLSRDLLRHRARKIRIIDRLAGSCALVVHFHALPHQGLSDLLFQAEPGMVGPYCDFHGNHSTLPTALAKQRTSHRRNPNHRCCGPGPRNPTRSVAADVRKSAFQHDKAFKGVRAPPQDCGD